MARYLRSFTNPDERLPVMSYQGPPLGIPFSMVHAFQGVANTADAPLSCSREACGMVEATIDAFGADAARTDLTFTWWQKDGVIYKARNSSGVTSVVRANDTLALDPDPARKAAAVVELTKRAGQELMLLPLTERNRIGAGRHQPSGTASPRPATATRVQGFVRSGVGRSRTTGSARAIVADQPSRAFSRPPKFAIDSGRVR